MMCALHKHDAKSPSRKRVPFTCLLQPQYLYRVAPQKTEQSIQSIFQDFALINSYIFHLDR